MELRTMPGDNDNDELEINPFYKALQDEYLFLFERAQQQCFWICVPLSDSINASLVGRSFVETHILRPSRLFTGHFNCINESRVKRVQVSDDGKFFIVETTSKGNSKGKEERIKIISEELAYNKDLKPFRILIIEKPLHPYFEAQTRRIDSRTKYLHTPKLSVQECTDFLMSFLEAKQNMDQLQGSISYFSRHYMVLEDYLDDAAVRIGDICSHALMGVLKTIKPPLRQDTKFLEVLAGAIESYVMSALHPKVFPVIRQKHSKDTETLLETCRKLNKVRPEQIGMRKEFACPLPTAVVELANLGSFHTPREKLLCLRTVVETATQGVADFVRDSHWAGLTQEPESCITSDDLIPILVMVIAHAKSSQLPVELFYIENFMFEGADKDRDNFSYCLVSFKAAVQYMISTDFSHLEEMKSSHEKEISIEELVKATHQNSNTHQRANAAATSASTTSCPPSDRLERQLSRISSLLEKAAMESTNKEKEKHTIQSHFPGHTLRHPAPDLIPSQEKQGGQQQSTNSLGDFLTSLQYDDFGQAFGKQS